MKRSLEDFRILVVDDEAEILDLIETYLKDQGEKATGVLKGIEAIKRHRENPYDLLIVDLNLPDISGIELIKKIKMEDPFVEFIIITGYASLNSAIQAIRLGAFDYLVKPFRLYELKVAVQNVKDKVFLKRINYELLEKLERLYEEIERYGLSKPPELMESKIQIERKEVGTQGLLEEIKILETLRKRRFFID